MRKCENTYKDLESWARRSAAEVFCRGSIHERIGRCAAVYDGNESWQDQSVLWLPLETPEGQAVDAPLLRSQTHVRLYPDDPREKDHVLVDRCTRQGDARILLNLTEELLGMLVDSGYEAEYWPGMVPESISAELGSMDIDAVVDDPNQFG